MSPETVQAVRFPLEKPRLGRARGSVTVAGALVIDHPLVREPIVVALDQIAGFAMLDDLGPGPDQVLARDLRVLPIANRYDGSGQLAIVLEQPVSVGRAKSGAERILPITARERRRGFAADVLVISVQDPGGLARALAVAGVPERDVHSLLLSVAGEAIGLERIERLALVERRTTHAARRIVGVGLGMAMFVAARLLLVDIDRYGFDVARVGRVLLATASIALLSGSVVAASRGRVEARGPVVGARFGMGGGRWVVLAAAIALAVGVVLGTDRVHGPPAILLMAIGPGLVGGFITGRAMRSLLPAQPDPHGGPAVVESRSSVPTALALVSLVCLTAACLTEPRMRDVFLARSALVDSAQLPAGWSTERSGPYTSGIDDHICGSPPGLPTHTGGYWRTFRRAEVGRSRLAARLEIGVILTPSEAAAKAEFEAVDSPGYRPCLLDRVEQMGTELFVDVTSSSAEYLGRTKPIDGLPVIVDESVVSIHSEGGLVGGAQILFIRMQIGRAIVRMPLSSFSGPADLTEIRAIIDAVYAEVAAEFDPI